MVSIQMPQKSLYTPLWINLNGFFSRNAGGRLFGNGIKKSQGADKEKKTIKECYSHYFFIFLSTLKRKRKNFLHYIKGILIRKFRSVFFYIKFWQHNLLHRDIYSLSRIFTLYYFSQRQKTFFHLFIVKVCAIPLCHVSLVPLFLIYIWTLLWGLFCSVSLWTRTVFFVNLTANTIYVHHRQLIIMWISTVMQSITISILKSQKLMKSE